LCPFYVFPAEKTKKKLLSPISRNTGLYMASLKGTEKLWARVPYTKTRKNVHINMSPEHVIFKMQLKEDIPNKCSKFPP
jgi:hypothetical protein